MMERENGERDEEWRDIMKREREDGEEGCRGRMK